MARLESDSIGTLEVPENAYYGVQTLRGYNNFRITGLPANYGLILNVVRIKKAAAIVNEKVGSLDKERADAIIKACDEVLSGALKDEFITDAIQGGAGTTFNMNVNEVIANRATVWSASQLLDFLGYENYGKKVLDCIETLLTDGKVLTPDLNGNAHTDDVGAEIVRLLSNML